ncbi:MAG TPA: DUF4350 domain-containing protein [Capsulimonadaceae bacterium]|jgi:hypothetical protein
MLAGNDTGGRRLIGYETTPNPSVYNDRGSGSRGLFDLVNKLGYKSDVERTKWRALPTNSSLLIAIQPTTTGSASGFGGKTGGGVLTSDDALAVRAWLEPGRTLLLMVNELPGPATAGTATPAKPVADGEFGDAAGFTVGAGLRGGDGVGYYAPLQPLTLFNGVGALAVHGGNRIRRPKGDAVVLFGRLPNRSGKGPVEGEPVAIMYRVGKGRVIAIADGYFACNNNLTRADNAAFLTNIITSSASPGERVLFDEYHHGDIDEGGTVWAALGSPIQGAFVQLAFATLVMILVLAPRFGTPKPPVDRSRRTSGEYVSSVASLYRGARATGPALEVIYRQFLRDVCARLSLPSDISLQDLADAAARRGHINGVQLKRLLGRCEHNLDSGTLSEAELLELVKQMEKFRKELGID